MWRSCGTVYRPWWKWWEGSVVAAAGSAVGKGSHCGQGGLLGARTWGRVSLWTPGLAVTIHPIHRAKLVSARQARTHVHCHWDIYIHSDSGTRRQRIVKLQHHIPPPPPQWQEPELTSQERSIVPSVGHTPWKQWPQWLLPWDNSTGWYKRCRQVSIDSAITHFCSLSTGSYIILVIIQSPFWMAYRLHNSSLGW